MTSSGKVPSPVPDELTPAHKAGRNISFGYPETARIARVFAFYAADLPDGLIYEYLTICLSPLEYRMDKPTKSDQRGKTRSATHAARGNARPPRAAAEAAVRTLILWAGDDPDREGMVGTPARVVRAYEEWFAGNFENPREYLQRTFEEVAGYDEIVLLRDIRFESHCEHHIAPIIGRVHIGYLPRDRVIGISKLVRLVEVYAKRLQVQEKMTAEIANCLNSVLRPFGVGVVVEAAHECMTTRGVHKPDVTMVTSCMLGTFRTQVATRQEFLSAINLKGASRAGGATG